MRLQRSSFAFFMHLASVVNSSPLEALQPSKGNAVEVRQNNGPTNSTALEPPHILLTIKEKCAIIQTGGTILGAGATGVTAAFAAYAAFRMKNLSDNHSCAVISGNVDGVNYQYWASGRNCDTTAEKKTIESAVEKALQYMIENQVTVACFELTHGGTWTGWLQVAGGGASIVNKEATDLDDLRA